MLDPGNARALRHAALLFLVAGAVGWIFYTLLFWGTLGQDWMVFDTAAHAYFRRDFALLLDGPRFTEILNATHAGWLREKLVFHPWVYPPYTLLLAIPFGLLPWWLNYLSFQLLSFAGLMAALRLWQLPGRAGWMLPVGVVLCPATAFTLGAGQNSFFSAALVCAGIHCMHRRPRLAGVLIGLLAFKPQLAILLPVALAAAGAWTAFASAAATVAALLLLSLAVPGLELWRGWLHLFLSGDPAFHEWVNAGRIYGQSVFTCLRLAGLPDAVANGGQLLAVLVSAALVWRAFRSAMPRAEQLAVLLCGMILAAAHVGNYDATMLGIASMLILQQGLTRPFRRGEALLAMLVWASTAIEPPFVFRVSVVAPVLVLALMVRINSRTQYPHPADQLSARM
jgi:alpha-1,2-mannosyltransferase